MSDGPALARLDYELLRGDLLAHPQLGPLIPPFVRACRDLDQFWAFISGEFDNYADRRKFIWKAFEPVFARIEGLPTAPADARVAEALTNLSADGVSQIWQTALMRRATDPDAAITTARTLLETVCKHILVDLNIPFDEGADLSKLYAQTANALTLAPDQHTEAVFKQILGGCKTVVDGLAAVRNRLSDAHGRSPSRAKPSERHAELAVNLAGATATFLVETWKARAQAS